MSNVDRTADAAFLCPSSRAMRTDVQHEPPSIVRPDSAFLCPSSRAMRTDVQKRPLVQGHRGQGFYALQVGLCELTGKAEEKQYVVHPFLCPSSRAMRTDPAPADGDGREREWASGFYALRVGPANCPTRERGLRPGETRASAPIPPLSIFSRDRHTRRGPLQRPDQHKHARVETAVCGHDHELLFTLNRQSPCAAGAGRYRPCTAARTVVAVQGETWERFCWLRRPSR